jgi:hypothetical protein
MHGAVGALHIHTHSSLDTLVEGADSYTHTRLDGAPVRQLHALPALELAVEGAGRDAQGLGPRHVELALHTRRLTDLHGG